MSNHRCEPVVKKAGFPSQAKKDVGRSYLLKNCKLTRIIHAKTQCIA